MITRVEKLLMILWVLTNSLNIYVPQHVSFGKKLTLTAAETALLASFQTSPRLGHVQI